MNRKESGSGAGPYRPCLQRESQAVTRRELPCPASHSLPQAKAKMPAPSAGHGTGRRGGSTRQAASQHPGGGGAGQGPERSKPCRPAQAQGQAESRGRGKHRRIPLGGTGSSPGFQGTSAPQGAARAGSKPGRGSGPWKQESCCHRLAPKRTTPGAAWCCGSCPGSGGAKAAGGWLGLSGSPAQQPQPAARLAWHGALTPSCLTLTTLQGDRPSARHPHLRLQPT